MGETNLPVLHGVVEGGGMSVSLDYTEFIRSKAIKIEPCGFTADSHPFLYDWQKWIVGECLRRGRAAIFADCGLGKTPMQLSWAQRVVEHTTGNVLIVTPLAVAEQTKKESTNFGIEASVSRGGRVSQITITNYEQLHKFTPDDFSGIVIDESSILKNFTGSMKAAIVEFAQTIPFRLACTATPAPNDVIELSNHAEFLGVMKQKEMVALYFRQDGNTTHKWRLKRHAEVDFWKWVASWAIACRNPRDIGIDDSRFTLPNLHIVQHTTDGHIEDGLLFPVLASTLQERHQARKESIDDRVSTCASLVNESSDPWVVWCNLNAESDALCSAIPDAVDVRGSHDPAVKVDRLLGFTEGKYRVLVTKPSIAGFGMNWQHCANMAFVGLSDSFEQFYQAVRRCWRFGQTREVTAHVVVAETEGAVVENIRRKERQATQMMAALVENIKGIQR